MSFSSCFIHDFLPFLLSFFQGFCVKSVAEFTFSLLYLVFELSWAAFPLAIHMGAVLQVGTIVNHNYTSRRRRRPRTKKKKSDPQRQQQHPAAANDDSVSVSVDIREEQTAETMGAVLGLCSTASWVSISVISATSFMRLVWFWNQTSWLRNKRASRPPGDFNSGPL